MGMDHSGDPTVGVQIFAPLPSLLNTTIAITLITFPLWLVWTIAAVLSWSSPPQDWNEFQRRNNQMTDLRGIHIVNLILHI
jgi:hypothetical protein